jgi:DNA-directed RNA polymerase specialized sigma24 family protein
MGTDRTDPGFLANGLVSSLSGYFEDLPSGLGREVYGAIKKRLRSEGFLDSFHAEEVLQMALTSAVKYLKRNGGGKIRQPRAWFHALGRRACIDYLKDLTVQSSCSLSSVMDDAVGLSNTTLTDQQVLLLLRQAIQQLRPRHQRLIQLDLVECQTPAKIQESLQLPSNGAFRKLKYEAFSALREAFHALIAGGISQLLS